MELDLREFKECAILFHQSTGDIFTSYPIVVHYSTLNIFEKIHIFTLHRNRHTTFQLFEKYSNVVIHELDDTYNKHTVPLDNFLKIKNSNMYCFLLGGHDGYASHCGNNYFKSNATDVFYKNFYNYANLDYSIKYKYKQLNRNIERETHFYNIIKSRYGHKYIFTHDHRSYVYRHYDTRPNVYVNSQSEFPIFHPNINYYEYDSNHNYYNLWPQIISNNLLDYCLIIENASEIYISDSCFSCLIPYLNLNASHKVIFTNLNMVDYDSCYETWNILHWSVMYQNLS